MKRTFFTSDHHFGHANILKYEDANRRNAHGGKFASIEKMDEYLIKQWNVTVAPGDLVYCLGDFSFKQSIMEFVLPRLHGKKVLIVGNHDPFYKRLTQCQRTKMHAEALTSALQAGFSEVHMELYIEVSGVGLVRLAHFPYLPAEPLPDYEQSHAAHWGEPCNETLLLHGHIHSQWQTKTEPAPMINVGVDMCRHINLVRRGMSRMHYTSACQKFKTDTLANRDVYGTILTSSFAQPQLLDSIGDLVN